jgi:RNA binding exosome subunit
MKQVHNVRVRVHNASRDVVDAVLVRSEAMSKRKDDEPVDTRVTEEDGLVIGELWLDRQQPVRHFLKELLATMSSEDKLRISTNPTRYLDTGTHCFFHLVRDAFIEGTCVLTDKPTGAVNVRLNVACWPATKENAVKTIVAVFSKEKEI